MALQMIEGFDTKIPITLRGWNVVGGSSYSAGRISGFCCAFNQANGVVYVLPTPAAAMVSGFAYQSTASAVAATREVLRFQTAGATLIASLSAILNLTSPYQIQLADSTGAVLYTSGAIYLPSNWYQFELKVNISGAWELRALGVTIASGSGANFGATNIGAINIGRANVITNQYDDLYVCDLSGSVNNDFIGDARIQTNLPTGDGAVAQWTPSTGVNHFANVDDVPPNDDTDYNSDATVGHIDTFTHASLPAGSAVKAVQASLYARKDDVSVRQIAPVIRRSGTNTALATVTLATGYAAFRQLMETDPITAVAWVDTNINSDEFGVKVIA